MDLRGCHIVMMGSCFATEVGERLIADGYDVTLNPFGVQYNPASICASIERLESGAHFGPDDVICRVDDAAKGIRRYVSYFHHGSFARETPESFLADANEALDAAVAAFAAADTVVITLGTAWVFRLASTGKVVSNCHKVPARAFTRELMSVGEITAMLAAVVRRHQKKHWIFTVSPIRHLADTLHGNQISKSTLLLAIDALQQECPGVDYFPSYEIMMDELRDYSWYSASNKTHPTAEAVDVIYRSFFEQ